jgi:ABC-type multidrug transport system ATPase subunit
VSDPDVQVTDLVKRYGEIEAVRGINFAVTAGETVGFLGPNGAGKSTTIKILCTRSSIREYVNDLKQREDITIFLTTHYMDEA